MRKGQRPVDRQPRPEHAENAAPEANETEGKRRGKLRISESAKSKLLDTADLSRFEIRKPKDKRHDGDRPYKSEKQGRRDFRRSDRSKTDNRGRRKNSDRNSTRRDPKR